ncbi:MAG: DUF721 domain-containing protein [Chlamydiae bacterium]|nr:DUF721 domain-containing protein [Chlamydiota bacterium]
MTRTPKNYDGNQPTARPIQGLLSSVLDKIHQKNSAQEKQILQKFTALLGPRMSPFIVPIKWEKGTLFVQVKSAAALSVMKQCEEARILPQLPDVVKISYQGLMR